MIRWWRRRRFTKKFQRAAKLHLYRGRITLEEYDRAIERSSKPRVMDAVIHRLESDLKGAFTWDDLWTFLEKHWFDVLKMVFTIAVLALDDEPA